MWSVYQKEGCRARSKPYDLAKELYLNIDSFPMHEGCWELSGFYWEYSGLVVSGYLKPHNKKREFQVLKDSFHPSLHGCKGKKKDRKRLLQQTSFVVSPWNYCVRECQLLWLFFVTVLNLKSNKLWHQLRHIQERVKSVLISSSKIFPRMLGLSIINVIQGLQVPTF